MIMKDDFSTKSNGWDEVNDEGRRITYRSGTYELLAKKATQIIAYPHPAGRQSSGDVLVQVDGSLQAGKTSHGYGVVCKSNDPNSLYRFNITNDGHYGIIKVSGGVEYRLQGATPSDAISPTGFNRLQALCVSYPDPPSTELSLWVNGHELKTIVDRSPPLPDGMRAGIYARDNSGDGGGTTWRFDNFRLWQLE